MEEGGGGGVISFSNFTFSLLAKTEQLTNGSLIYMYLHVSPPPDKHNVILYQQILKTIFEYKVVKWLGS